MKRFGLSIALLSIFLLSGVNAQTAKAQVRKACEFGQIGSGASLIGQVPIDKNSQTQDETYKATAYKVGGGGFSYLITDKFNKSVSRVELEYFKPTGKGQLVKISVCGRVQNNPNIPYLNFKFLNSRTIKVKALGTQSFTYSVSKPAHTTTVQTLIEL